MAEKISLMVCSESHSAKCHNNIRKLKLNKSEEAAHWYQYIDTAEILNAWDTSCDAMNGCDKDINIVLLKLGEPTNVGCRLSVSHHRKW